MSLEIARFVLGPMQNNCYLITDSITRESVVIDPSFNSEHIIQYIQQHQINLKGIWITHAHFDHFIGVSTLISSDYQSLEIALHKDDLSLWQQGGEAPELIDPQIKCIPPDILLRDGAHLSIGNHPFTVIHTPGHSPGHVIFYSPEIPAAFCGDTIFHGNIGRTDLTGGDYNTLIHSIKMKILALPPQTILYSGHGIQTTVGDEARINPFLI